MLAATSIQDQGRTCASLAVELRRVVEKNVTIRDDGLGIEPEKILEELRRSLTYIQSVVSETVSKLVREAAV